jgi:predicted nucleic acid-binding protein
MKTIFIDSDVVVDFLFAREPHFISAARLFEGIQNGTWRAVTSPVVLANVFYLLEKSSGRTRAVQAIAKLRLSLGVCAVTEETVDEALASDFADFEDALQYYSAVAAGAAALVTRNVRDYAAAIDLAVCTPSEFLGYYN